MSDPVAWPVMAYKETSVPIKIILDGTNFYFWSSPMTIYLKEKMLWKYIIGERTRPIRAANDSEEKYLKKLEKWESQNNLEKLEKWESQITKLFLGS